MKVKLAKRAGFCMGVKRAMDIVIDLSSKENKKLFTYGPLIHNPQVIKSLKKKGIQVYNNLNNIPPSTPLVIRTHGISPDKRNEIKKKGILIKDATCPLVMKVQSIIKKHTKNGFSTIIIGDKGHAEVTGLMGFAGKKGYIINSLSEVDLLPVLDKVCIVAQTTLNTKLFNKISKKLFKKYPNCKIENSICDATESRQKEAAEICKTVDAMIVVGGKNSANTNRLVDICTESKTPTFFIETESELNEKILLKFNTIGITAGASTPNWMIMRVVEKVKSIENANINKIKKYIKSIFSFFIRSNIVTALGGICLSYTSCTLQQIQPRLSFTLIPFFYLFSMHVLNNFTDQDAIRLASPSKTELFNRNKIHFIIWGTVTLLLSLFISLGLGILQFLITLMSSACGVAYSIKLFPIRHRGFFKYQRLKDIPGSKDIFVSLAWSVICVLIPFSSIHLEKIEPKNIITFLFIFTIVYIRSVIFDIKDIQADKIVGRETIPTIIGKEKTKLFLTVLAGITALILAGASLGSYINSLGYFLQLSILYICIYLYLYHKRIIYQGILFEGVVDGSFIFVGIITFFYYSSTIL